MVVVESDVQTSDYVHIQRKPIQTTLFYVSTCTTCCPLFDIFAERRKKEMLTEDGSRKVSECSSEFVLRWRGGGGVGKVANIKYLKNNTGQRPSPVASTSPPSLFFLL